MFGAQKTFGATEFVENARNADGTISPDCRQFGR